MTLTRWLASALLLVLAACTRAAVLPAAQQDAVRAPEAAGARASRLFVSPLTVPGKIVVLPPLANGTIAPSRTIASPITDFALNYYIAYDRRNNRLWATSCLELGLSGGPVVAFDADAQGTKVKPDVLIAGKKTGLSGCQNGIAVDRQGYAYVADLINQPSYPGGQVAVFGPDQQGNVAPVRRIAGTKAQMKSPEGVALDASGRLYVANSCQGFNPCTGGINVYAAGANGNVAPSAFIGGSRTKLRAPFGVTFDSASNMYVIDPGTNAIEEFKAGATGNVAPMRVITGKKTQIRTPSGIAVDKAGFVYVGNFDQSTSNNSWPILVFAPNAAGNAAPVQTIRVNTKRFDQPSGIALK